MASPAPKPTLFGHYVLDRKLAEGGMAEVFLARHQGLGGFEKQVVVKRILPSLSTDTAFVDMFLNEARLAARLNHTNVVQVIEAGEVSGQYYIAMEYIDGADLRLFYDEMEKTGAPTPPGIACRIIADLLAGLHYAHTRSDEQHRPLGIVHRDVSPQNVLVTRSGTVKIVDFGIAKATRAATVAQQTQIGQVKGKIAYLSPEQAMGRPLDARSDVFACGILLWELTTGARLFSRPNDMASILAITEDDMPTARSVRKELPEALERVLLQALARPLHDRFPSAQAMQRELEALIRSQGWQGDQRALQRHMESRLGGSTPAFGAPTMESDQLADEPITDPASQFVSAPTALASQQDLVPPPRERNNATVPMMAAELPEESPPPAPVRTPPPRQAVSTPPPMEAPVPGPAQPARPRTPSGMRSMPPTPGPAQPVYMAPPVPFAITTQPGARRTGSRLLVVITAAVLCSAGAIVAVEWNPDHAPTVSPMPGSVVATLQLEVAEPVWVELEGKRTRIDKTGSLELPPGKQLSIVVTSVAGDPPQKRTIDVPPASPGERVPMKISFPPK